MLPVSYRQLNAIGLLICIVSICFAYFYLQLHLGFDACPLCLIDRGLIVAIGFFFLLGLIHNPATLLVRRIYASGALLFSILGVIVCWRHLWLQNLPKDQIPECSPGLDYMLETFPIGETIRTIFTTAGECADIQWDLFGLSIPAQTLLVFLVLTALSVLLLVKRN